MAQTATHLLNPSPAQPATTTAPESTIPPPPASPLSLKKGVTVFKSIGHEIGHMLGNLDEYNLRDANKTANKKGAGIMNNPAERPKPRHFNTIVKNSGLPSLYKCKVIENGCPR